VLVLSGHRPDGALAAADVWAADLAEAAITIGGWLHDRHGVRACA